MNSVLKQRTLACALFTALIVVALLLAPYARAVDLDGADIDPATVSMDAAAYRHGRQHMVRSHKIATGMVYSRGL